MADGFVLRTETQVAAPAATVFAFLIDPEKLLRWIGNGATMEAQPGGLYLLEKVSGRNTARGTFKEVVPVHRLSYTFGWDEDPGVPPGSSLVEIDLIEQNGGTLVRMTHSGLPTEQDRANHEKGWKHYLERLSAVAAGATVGPDQKW
ncbi:SRPBCC family protein [Dongia sp. agr-C8]